MIQLHHMDCLELTPSLSSGSIDIICIDPPYLYLKGQKLERPFDEHQFFSECKRLLTKDGFIILFGRGTSFYRWNTILADLGFSFKEEVIWDKSYSSSPLMAMSRIHETVSVWTKGNGVINKVKIPYLEMKGKDINSIITDIKRLKTTFKNTKSLDAVLDFLENNEVKYNNQSTFTKFSVTTDERKKADRCVQVMHSMQHGYNEKTIIRTDKKEMQTAKGVNSREGLTEGNKCVNVIQSIGYGMNEKTIIKQTRDHYSAIHPTQKPVRLLERLIQLVLPKNKPRNEVTIADFFGGSFSTMEAAFSLGCNGIACEIDKEYFDAGKARIDNIKPKGYTLFD